jgi:circadian clock protein KaiA
MDEVAQIVQKYLDQQRYNVMLFRSQSDFLAAVQRERQHIDCLILYEEVRLPTIVHFLQEQALFLPTLILHALPDGIMLSPHCHYHAAEVYLPIVELDHLGGAIDRAMTTFLDLSPACAMENHHDVQVAAPMGIDKLSAQNLIRDHQQRLANKLKERLGYLGVYYKRDPECFARSMPLEERQQFLKSLKAAYREIIITYFRDDPTNNDKIDDFVNTVFFADLPVAKVVEIHMDLIDEFSKQLKLEGRSEEILLDYRLTLIDTLAHLCEMYRRSIPREMSE